MDMKTIEKYMKEIRNSKKQVASYKKVLKTIDPDFREWLQDVIKNEMMYQKICGRKISEETGLLDNPNKFSFTIRID
jgi:hypothetical protein